MSKISPNSIAKIKYVYVNDKIMRTLTLCFYYTFFSITSPFDTLRHYVLYCGEQRMMLSHSRYNG